MVVNFIGCEFGGAWANHWLSTSHWQTLSAINVWTKQNMTSLFLFKHKTYSYIFFTGMFNNYSIQSSGAESNDKVAVVKFDFKDL